MNFTEIVAEVVDMTKRPDKIVAIRKAVNQALTYACTQTNFARDLQERSIAINASQYAQNIALSEFVRFRKFCYIKPDNRNCYVKPLEADKIFAKGIEMLDKYYIAGNQVNFKLSALAPNLLVGWFAYPPVLTDAAPTHWLLDIQPYMIIDKAAATVFKDIGDDQSASKKNDDFKEQYLAASSDLKYGAAHG